MSKLYYFSPLTLAAVIALLGFSFPDASLAIGSAPGDVAAYITEVRGDAEIFVTQRSESGRSLGRRWIKASVGFALLLKDRIRTGNGEIIFEFTDHDESCADCPGPSRFELGPNSEVGLDEYEVDFENPGNSSGLLNLIRGAIRNYIKGWGGSSFSVRASGLVARLGDGEYHLEYEPETDRMHLYVRRGEAVLTGPGGSRIVKEGQSATMIRGHLQSKPLS